MRKFIWLNKKNYHDYQKTICTCFDKSPDCRFAVSAFRKKYKFEKNVKRAEIRIFADTKYFLYVNKEYLGSGPVCPGGDYANTRPMPVQYFSTYSLDNIGSNIEFYILVQHMPGVQSDMSCGRCGLWLECSVTYEDGTKEVFSADESWLCRLETEYITLTDIDFTMERDDWQNAEFCENVWNLKQSPIHNLEEEKITPISINENNGVIDVEFDKIYAAYIVFSAEGEDVLDVEMQAYETKTKVCEKYRIKGKGRINCRTIRLDSIGGIKLVGIKPNELKDLYIMYSHYPNEHKGDFKCNDDILNTIYEVGMHTTEICRQTIELDSPNHQENLGCTGDYFIESLISYYCFGDTSLSRFDVIRTAEYLLMTEGKMFHTSYSLIWVYMLYDNYMFSGDKSVLEETETALSILLDRFAGYVGENGVIENSPDYMFVDWVPVDEFNLHHPPKALGQSVLTAFYYHALQIAEKIYTILENPNKTSECEKRAECVKEAFNQCFYDSERGLYFAGLNTPSNEGEWLPKNTHKRYYLKHTNVLAVLYDLCEDSKALMQKVIEDRTLIDVQPYFMHFVLEALYHSGLFEKYGLREIYRWKAMIDECSKGMKEAWGDFPGYGYDYSHAWGATPTYQLMSKISGLKIIEPGFKKIELKPNLFGLKWADIRIPTPYGIIECKLGTENNITVPDEVTLI